MELFEYFYSIFINFIETLQSESTEILNKYGGV